MMKKVNLLAILCCAFMHSFAQNEEINITYSPVSLYRFEKWVDGSFEGQSKYFVLGAFNLEYKRYLNPWLKIGASCMYDKAVAEGNALQLYYNNSPSTSISDIYRSTKSALVIAPQIDFEYLHHPKFKLSSGLSIGYGIERFRTEGGLNSSIDLDGITYHINLLSFQWGKKHGLTGNIGLGYKGLCNLGYFVRF